MTLRFRSPERIFATLANASCRAGAKAQLHPRSPRFWVSVYVYGESAARCFVLAWQNGAAHERGCTRRRSPHINIATGRCLGFTTVQVCVSAPPDGRGGRVCAMWHFGLRADEQGCSCPCDRYPAVGPLIISHDGFTASSGDAPFWFSAIHC
ncbi:hypothetical protein FA95DRAFT_1348771 [Auriscalpium vulgare]|uniref:Uncharacterized protein n=1 Tax=Auriscalpium vulgare TaxID=40419 RepID=A0ACB8RQY2_9AGAM|nr:hypothetical protein FA95DRAFT_1348771 [Auriscalpium vulgare]